MHPKVTVVIINWNGKAYLDRCLASVANQTYDNYNVILVDNGSTDGSAQFVKTNYPRVEVIALNRNYEFAGANNIGIKKALSDGAEFIALLNNDTKADKEWLLELAKAIEQDDRIGICASKMLRMDDPRIIDSAGHVFKDDIPHDRGHGEVDNGQYDGQLGVLGGCAGASLYRKEMFEEIGLFDESYGIYYEDAELSWRSNRRGWKARFVPKSIVYHVRGGSTSGNKGLREELRRRGALNAVRMVKRYATLKQRIRISLIWLKEAIRQRTDSAWRKPDAEDDYLKKLILLWFKKI